MEISNYLVGMPQRAALAERLSSGEVGSGRSSGKPWFVLPSEVLNVPAYIGLGQPSGEQGFFGGRAMQWNPNHFSKTGGATLLGLCRLPASSVRRTRRICVPYTGKLWVTRPNIHDDLLVHLGTVEGWKNS